MRSLRRRVPPRRRQAAQYVALSSPSGSCLKTSLGTLSHSGSDAQHKQERARFVAGPFFSNTALVVLEGQHLAVLVAVTGVAWPVAGSLNCEIALTGSEPLQPVSCR